MNNLSFWLLILFMVLIIFLESSSDFEALASIEIIMYRR